MPLYAQSVRLIIEAKYSQLTNTERIIADYFLQNKEMQDFASGAVSKRLFVSEASLSRFAQKCGFRGYRDFCYAYEDGFIQEKAKALDSEKMVLGSYQELLSSSRGLVDKAQIHRLVGYLQEKSRVLACGRGSSGLVAQEMESRFGRIGVDIQAIHSQDAMRMKAVFVNPQMLVCGFSVSGESPAVLYLLRESKKRGARTVLFTAREAGGFSDFCDEVIKVASLRYLDTGKVISPQFPLLLVLDVIYNEYLAKDFGEKSALHEDTMRALKEGGSA